MAQTVAPETLALQRLYHWEETTPDKLALTQPIGGGEVREWTWRQMMDEVRRMARDSRPWPTTAMGQAERPARQ